MSASKESGAFSFGKYAGWGRFPSLSGRLYTPESKKDLNELLKADALETRIARGLGRSYGDAALNSSAMISNLKLNRVIDFQPENGILRCQPGFSFAEMLDCFLPRGWFPPVTPGSKYVTMGGALASDIHGKNHHKEGSFSNFVRSFKLIIPGKEEVLCSPDSNSELFYASSGGMGLTGFVSEIELALKPVSSPFILVKKLLCRNLSETIDLIEKHENDYEYSVSWIDCLASGQQLGRSILILGKHACREDLAALDQSPVLDKEAKKISVPFDMPSFMLNRYSIGAFNELYYQLGAFLAGAEKISDYDSFFYPLDSILNWNRLYGGAGFIQFQCVLPLSSSKEGLEEILALTSARGRASFLAVLKKFGKSSGLLSFPMPGYTLTLDMPVKSGIFAFIAELDQLVIKYGGRVYLAKDAALSAESLRKMYPELDKWLEIKRAIDPKGLYSSALSQRLQLY